MMMMMMNENNIIESTLTNVTSLLLVLFTYVIPLLSSIRTIHNRDKESYTQWLAYWLIVHTFMSPLFSFLKFYKIFHLSLVLWLSLPRFQGATFIYNEVVDTFLIKYSLEAKVDDKIDNMKKSVKDALWNIAKDIGWGFLYQIGGVVSFVQDSAASFVEENSPSKKSQSQRKNENYDRSSDDNNLDDADVDVDNNDIGDEYDSNDNDSKNDNVNDGAVAVPPKSFRQPSFPSSIGSQPSHSVYESFSSLTALSASSIESVSDLAVTHTVTSSEREAYVADFLDMLEKGLYVFAWHNGSSIIYQQYNDVDVDNANTTSNETHDSKRFRLQIFTFHRGNSRSEGEGGDNENTNTNKNENGDSYFVFNSVESRPGDENTGAISFPVSATTRVQESGTNGIQFVNSIQLNELNSPPTCTTMSMSQSASEPSLTKTSIIGSSTSSLVSAVSEGDIKHYSDDASGASRDSMVEEIVAEIVLSDIQDRNILLAGLNIFLSKNNIE